MSFAKKILCLLLIVASSKAMAQESGLQLTYTVKSGPFSLGSTSLYLYQTEEGLYKIQQDKDIYIPGFYKDRSTSLVQGSIDTGRLYPNSYSQIREGSNVTRTTKIQWKDGEPTVIIDPPIDVVSYNANAAMHSIDPISTIYQVMLAMNTEKICGPQISSFDGVSTMKINVSTIHQNITSRAVSPVENVGCQLNMIGTSGLIMNSTKNAVSSIVIWFGKPLSSDQFIPVTMEFEHKNWSFSMHLKDVSTIE
jgi:hypothetical protein